MRITIPGAPRGKARPRVTKRGTYTPEETRRYEELVRACWAKDGGERFGDDAALNVLIMAWFPIPQSTSKAKRMEMLLGHIRPAKKPDCDNVAKIICDALNGCAYKDDAQIVRCTIAKYYSETPRVEVDIQEVNHEQTTNYNDRETGAYH